MSQTKTSNNSKPLEKIFNPDVATGPIYKNLDHPLFPFFNKQFRKCDRCPLQCGGAVPGAGPLDIHQVKLIVISDYPGHYEKKHGWPQVPRPYAQQQEELEAQGKGKTKRRRTPYPSPNSGEYLRESIQRVLNLNPWENIYYTNAIKCPTEIGRTKINITGTHLKACQQWLLGELDILSEHVPDVPIFIMGSKALSAFNLITGQKHDSLMKLYRCGPLWLDGRPVFFTFNPALVSKGRVQIIEQIKIRNGQITPTRLRPWSAMPTPQWHFEQSLKAAAPYLYPDHNKLLWDKDEGILIIRTTLDEKKGITSDLEIHGLQTGEEVLKYLESSKLDYLLD